MGILRLNLREIEVQAAFQVGSCYNTIPTHDRYFPKQIPLETAAMQGSIDQIVSSLDVRPQNTGLIVGVVKDGQLSVFGYGRASQANGEPPTGDTIFEIASITKVFTASLLSILIADGLLNLEDAVCNLVPALSHLPPEITLGRLATHTAGLPKMPSNLLPSMLKNRNDPFAAYTEADLLAYLSKYQPRRTGESAEPVYLYSNLGYALLGYTLAQRAGFSYQQVLVNRICLPLDMPDTLIALSPEQETHLAPPHKANGKPALNWDLSGFAGAGALRSTANNLLKFLAANLGTPPSDLTGLLQACHLTHPGNFPPPGFLPRMLAALFREGQDTRHYEQAMGLGWHVGQLSPGGAQVHWRHGATGGYKGFIGFVKETGSGVVALANRGLEFLDPFLNTSSADKVGFSVLEFLNSSR